MCHDEVQCWPCHTFWLYFCSCFDFYCHFMTLGCYVVQRTNICIYGLLPALCLVLHISIWYVVTEEIRSSSQGQLQLDAGEAPACGWLTLGAAKELFFYLLFLFMYWH